MTTVVFGDVAAAMLTYIGDELDVVTGTRVPNPRPESFVLARRVGGDRSTPVTEAVRLLFECWAGSPADADDLASNVRALLFELAPPGAFVGTDLNGISIRRIDDVSGTADQPDELSDQPRATFILSFSVRGSIQEESI